MQSNHRIQQPRLGIAVLIGKDNKVLLGERLKSPMLDSWQLPGGWVFEGESPVQAAQRQIQKFPDIICGDLECVSYSNNIFESGLHTLSLYFQTQCLSLDDVNIRLNKDCKNWIWVEWTALPDRLFLPLQNLVDSGFDPNFNNIYKN